MSTRSPLLNPSHDADSTARPDRFIPGMPLARRAMPREGVWQIQARRVRRTHDINRGLRMESVYDLMAVNSSRQPSLWPK